MKWILFIFLVRRMRRQLHSANICNGSENEVPLRLGRSSIQFICPVKPVQYFKRPVIHIELKVVVVVKLVRGQKRDVIAAMTSDSSENCNSQPQPVCEEMRVHHERADCQWRQIDKEMLQRVGVYR